LNAGSTFFRDLPGEPWTMTIELETAAMPSEVS
jgi:hypothetical protein